MPAKLDPEEKRRRARARWKQWADENREHLRETQRAWKRDNPDKVVSSRKRYAKAHPEKIVEKWKRHQANHPDKCAARTQRYRDKNREAVREYLRAYFQTPEGKAARINGERRRRAKKMGSEIVATAKQITELLANAAACCYCDASFSEDCPPTLEHKVPLAKGGAHSMNNLDVACGMCNSKKGVKMPEEFLSQMGAA